MPQHLYSAPPPPNVPTVPTAQAPPPSAPVTNFLEAHGTVVLLYSLLLILYGAAAFFAIHYKMDGEKVFAYFSGVATGTFNALAIAMRVSNGTTGK